MKKTELLLLGLSVTTLAMKFLHIPGSGILTVLSLASISVFYMYLGTAVFNNVQFKALFKKESYKGISTKRIIGGIGTGLALSVATIGILFKLQSWPGASNQLKVGLFGLTIILGISLFKFIKSYDTFYSNILKRVVSFGAICFILFVIPNKTWLDWKYPNNPEYVNAIINAQANPNDPALWEKVDIEREKMQENATNRNTINH